MKKQFQKQRISLSVLICFFLFLGGCSNNSKIEGHYLSGDKKYSVSFAKDNTIVVDGKYIGEYEIYDEGKMAINVDTDTFDEVLDINMSAEYSLVDGVLQIYDTETGRTYEYFKEEKVNQFINDDYSLKNITYNGLKEIPLYYPLGYFNDNGELIKEFDWEFEGDLDEIKKARIKAETLFEEEVLCLYKLKNPNGKYHVFSIELVGVDGAILHGIELRSEGAETLSIVDRFLVETEEELIYVEDLIEGIYYLWDGTVIDGVSLFEK